MDISLPVGLILGVIAIIMGVYTSGGSMGMIVSIASLFVTVGGSIGAMLVGFKIPKLLKIPGLIRLCVFPPKYNPKELIVTLVSFSEKARREGLLALEDDLDELDDTFMRKGLQLVVDGTDSELVRHVMEREVEQMASRHDENKRMFDDWASLAPAFGMIGTLLGLIMMLVNIEDRSTLGPFLATALITTLYGAIMAYLLFNPIASKLDQMTTYEIVIKSIIVEGTLSIQQGDNPRIVKDKLVSFLPPSDREAINEEVGD